MDLNELLIPIEVNYGDREGNLDVESSGVVKSKKYFPIYKMNGKEYIFKPLSRTKPLTTDLFAFAEVYWSYVMKKYFDDRTPLYRLAYCRGIEEKYYEKGTLVERIGKGKFINLLEYFKKNPEETFDISEYVNYCMKNYDYTVILESSFIRENPQIGEELAYQVLLSILRMDQNFHYENVNMEERDNGLEVVAPIDSEFSMPFLYPENIKGRNFYIDKYFRSLVFPSNMQWEIAKSLKDMDLCPASVLLKNIYVIERDFPGVIDRFLNNLEVLYRDIDGIELNDKKGFIGDCSSDYWMIGHEKYKSGNLEKAKELEQEISKIHIDKEKVFGLIKSDIKMVCERIKSIIWGMRLLKKNGYVNLEDMTIDRLAELLGMEIDTDKINYQDILSKVKSYK